VFAVVDHHAFIWVKADRKLTGTAAAGFFDAPDAAIAGQVMVFGMDWFRYDGLLRLKQRYSRD
jgi:hypothetical protein